MAGLFDMLGGDEAAMQRQLDEQRAAKFAEQTQEQRLAGMGYKAGAGLGRGLAGAFGVDVADPALKQAAELRRMAQDYDTQTAEGMAKFARALQSVNPQAAQQAATLAAEMAQKQATLTKTNLEINKATNAGLQEEQLRKELSQLGPETTEEDILKVVTKYVPSDKVLVALQTSQNKRADRAQKADLQKERIDAQNQRDRDRAQERKDFAVLVNSLKQGQTQGKPLSTNDIKEVNKLKVNVDTANNTIDQADKFISLIDNNKMQFGAGENALGVARKVFGKANESDLNKVEFEQFVTSSVNNILNLAKGPQTDQDAKRAEKQIIDGLSQNDNAAVKRGLTSLKKVWNDAKQTDISSLELFSSERGGKSLTPSTEASKPSGMNNDPLGIRTK